jgi:hypothetical protein
MHISVPNSREEMKVRGRSHPFFFVALLLGEAFCEVLGCWEARDLSFCQCKKCGVRPCFVVHVRWATRRVARRRLREEF